MRESSGAGYAAVAVTAAWLAHWIASPWAAWAVLALLAAGTGRLLGGARRWLADRFVLDRHVFTVHRRWDRPGARVILRDGRAARILAIYHDPDVAEPMTAVQPESSDESAREPVWCLLPGISGPAPRRQRTGLTRLARRTAGRS